MWQATYEAGSGTTTPKKASLMYLEHRYSNYLTSPIGLDLRRIDIVMSLVSAGCHHLSIKIFQHLGPVQLLFHHVLFIIFKEMAYL